jgi:uncharacterized membrane protein (UPF0127 family)
MNPTPRSNQKNPLFLRVCLRACQPQVLRAFAVIFLLLSTVTACKPKNQYPLPVTEIQIGNKPFSIEIAISFKDQETGLMHRDSLDPDHGMIFISDTAKVQDFWNHDVHFPLDLLFLDEKANIVSIKHMKPYDETGTFSDAPAKYTIELLGGTAANLGLKVGDHITLPPEVLQPNVVISH